VRRLGIKDESKVMFIRKHCLWQALPLASISSGRIAILVSHLDPFWVDPSKNEIVVTQIDPRGKKRFPEEELT
jgi:hypothetical protein